MSMQIIDHAEQPCCMRYDAESVFTTETPRIIQSIGSRLPTNEDFFRLYKIPVKLYFPACNAYLHGKQYTPKASMNTGA